MVFTTDDSELRVNVIASSSVGWLISKTHTNPSVDPVDKVSVSVGWKHT